MLAHLAERHGVIIDFEGVDNLCEAQINFDKQLNKPKEPEKANLVL